MTESPPPSPESSSRRASFTPPPVPPAAPPRRSRWRRSVLKIGGSILTILIVGCVLWVWISLTFSYSSGEKTGYVNKLAETGWLCKTWEGEMTVTPTPGVQSQVVPFTIRNDSVAMALQNVVAQRVTLHYEQHRGVPTSCFGETEYYITGFRVVE